MRESGGIWMKGKVGLRNDQDQDTVVRCTCCLDDAWRQIKTYIDSSVGPSIHRRMTERKWESDVGSPCFVETDPERRPTNWVSEQHQESNNGGGAEERMKRKRRRKRRNRRWRRQDGEFARGACATNFTRYHDGARYLHHPLQPGPST